MNLSTFIFYQKMFYNVPYSDCNIDKTQPHLTKIAFNLKSKRDLRAGVYLTLKTTRTFSIRGNFCTTAVFAGYWWFFDRPHTLFQKQQ